MNITGDLPMNNQQEYICPNCKLSPIGDPLGFADGCCPFCRTPLPFADKLNANKVNVPFLLLSIFLGWLGAGYYYVKQTWLGFIYGSYMLGICITGFFVSLSNTWLHHVSVWDLVWFRVAVIIFLIAWAVSILDGIVRIITKSPAYYNRVKDGKVTISQGLGIVLCIIGGSFSIALLPFLIY